MIKQVCEFFPNLTQINLRQQFVWFMSQENERCTIERSKFIANSMDLRSKELESYIINHRTSHTTKKQKIKKIKVGDRKRVQNNGMIQFLKNMY